MSITTEYPLWFLIFCLLAGGLLTTILYYKNPIHKELSGLWIALLVLLRFTVCFILAFLLLGPFIRTLFREVEKPIVVIAHDNSLSIPQGMDSIFLFGKYKTSLEHASDELKEKFDVRYFSFGEKVSESSSWSFSEKQTDLTELFSELDIRFYNRNMGAVILASDGIINTGGNPLYSAFLKKTPMFVIALGDSSKKKDIILQKINNNRIAYLGNIFPLEIIVNARQARGGGTEVTVRKQDQTLFSQEIKFSSDNQTLLIPVRLKANETGLQRYKISVIPVEGEISVSNNTRDLFIDVLDSRQKILLLGNSPHPDIGAIRQAIEKNVTYEVETALAANFSGAVEKYNLIILHQIPSMERNSSQLLQDIRNAHVPVLYIIGAQSSMPNFNALNTGLTISGGGNKMNESQPVFSSSFNRFTVSDPLKKTSEKFPPLYAPFGNYNTGTLADVLFYQKIGAVPTRQPLIAFNVSMDDKAGIIAGEGIWKWKFFDFSQNGNNDVFNELMSKIVQYLSVKADKSFFRIISKNNFFENEPVLFDAEVYNDSYELINNPEVEMVITNEDGKKYPFLFHRTEQTYHLSCGLFPWGEYRYDAKVKVGDKIFTDRGIFAVSPLVIESLNSVADHPLLYSLAAKTGGELVYPGEIESLAEKIRAREDIKPVSYLHKELKAIINLKWICFMLIALLGIEWFVRKRSGVY